MYCIAEKYSSIMNLYTEICYEMIVAETALLR